jgi:hypothetical protein
MNTGDTLLVRKRIEFLDVDMKKHYWFEEKQIFPALLTLWKLWKWMAGESSRLPGKFRRCATWNDSGSALFRQDVLLSCRKDCTVPDG